jgi:membrane protease YdiL (CAAX protease family)
MEIILLLILVLGLILVANKVESSGDPRATRLFTWFLLLLNVPVLLLGIGLLVFPLDQLAALTNSSLPPIDTDALGIAMIGIGLWGILSCLTVARQLLARIIPLDPDSPVHLTALILAGYLVGNTAVTISQEYLLQLSSDELEVSITEVVLQQIAFILVALTGVGLFIRRERAGVFKRLDLIKPTLPELAIGVLIIIFLIIIQGTVGTVWAFLDPEQAAELGNLNEALLAGFDSIGEWFVLALATGFGEEILFRGALQPVFGLPVTSLLFAVVHVQYGLTPITIVVFVLGLILGLVRRYTNTTVAIFVHFGYNFSLGLFSLLALYLEQFVAP